MPIYLVTTSSGERIVHADNQKSAINHVLRSEVVIEPLSAVKLSELMSTRSDLKIEKVKQSEQSDLEDIIAEQEVEPLDDED